MGRVIVDTSIWSLALRRRPKDLSAAQRALTLRLRDLIIEGDAVLLGAIRQEILTGIADRAVFQRLSDRLRDFDDIEPDIDDYERAAAAANECARHGVAATTVDMLLCAVAAGRDLPIFTTDHDFNHYAHASACSPFDPTMIDAHESFSAMATGMGWALCLKPMRVCPRSEVTRQ